MKFEVVKKVLTAIGSKVPAVQPRSGWTLATCPLAPWRHDNGTDKNPAFAVKKESGDPFCNCFACNYHGTLSDLLLEAYSLNKKAKHVTANFGELMTLVDEAAFEDPLDLDGPGIEEILFGKKDSLHPFQEWWLETFPSVLASPVALAYLKDRNVTEAVIKSLDLRYDPNENRICFPVRDFTGMLVGLHGRAISLKTDPRYRMYLYAKKNNPIVWLGEHSVDRTRPVVVVEGPFDLAAVRQVYSNVVSPLFASPSEAKIMRMADALEIITLFDRGKGGDAGRSKFHSVLGSTHMLTHLVPPDDYKDPGEMSAGMIAEILGEYVQLSSK